MGLAERALALRGGEPRYSADTWISDYLLPSVGQFGFGGAQYPYGLTTSYARQKVQEISTTLPGHMAALRGCPPAFAAQMVRALVLSQVRFTFRNPPSSRTPRRTFGTNALSVLEKPWPNATTGELVARMEWHAGLAGNAYVTNRTPGRLRVLRPDWVAIVYGSQQEPEQAAYALDGDLLGYVYAPGGLVSTGDALAPIGGGGMYSLLPEEVAHWSPLPDPECAGIGMSWITPAVREIQGDIAASQHKLQFFLNGAPQPLDARVLTPGGWSTMGEIQVGSRVIGSDGKPHDVLAVYPQGERDIYRVTFSGGAQVECTEDHLWAVASYADRKAGVTRTMTLAQIVAGGVRYDSGPAKWSVPLVAPVEFDPPGDLPVDPYLLGCLLGDGHLGGNTKGSGAAELACHAGDVAEQVRLLAPLGPVGTRLVVRHDRGSCARINFAGPCGTMKTRTCEAEGCDRRPRALGLCTMHYQRPGIAKGRESRTNPLTEALKQLGLWGRLGYEKSIPEPYLRASVTQRVALLQGLLDTDGSVEKAQPNTVRFISTSETLCVQLADLVGGLGGIATVRPSQRVRRGPARPQWCVNISRLPQWIVPCRLARKADRYRPTLRGGAYRHIRDVEYVGRKPAQCIGVDSDDHLYVTDDFILTHNTPNLVVKGIPATLPNQFDELVEMMEAQHRGLANAYKTLYLVAGADASVIGSDMQQIDFKATIGAGETRISVLSRVPAPVLGISEGLAGSSLNAGNFGQARRLFADTWVYPSAQDLCSALAPLVRVPSDAELWFDTTDMPLLREDARDAAEILNLQITGITMAVREGFTAESAVATTVAQDPSLLKHSGLTSVQLQPPGSGLPVNGSGPTPGDGGPKAPAPSGGPTTPPSSPRSTPTGEERKFNPNQPRVPGGEHGGEWTSVEGVAGRIRDLLASLVEGEGIYYHGTRGTLSGAGHEIFITDRKNAALGYLEGGRGKVYALRLSPQAKIAGEDDLSKAAEDIWGDVEQHFGYRPYTYELADQKPVRDRLRGHGFAGAEFVDLGPDNAYEHPTIVVWDQDVLTTEASVEIPEHDRSDLVEFRAEFDPTLHPRGAQGRFRTTLDRIVDGLRRWAQAGGKGDPFEGFTREQLRRTAVARGVTLRRGASGREIRDGLLDNLRDALAGDQPSPVKKAAKKAPPRAPEAIDLASLRTLDDPEAIRDALDLHKIPELKDALREQKLPLSGRKRELVDRLVEHLSGTEKPTAKKATKKASAGLTPEDFAALEDAANHNPTLDLARPRGGRTVSVTGAPDGFEVVDIDRKENGTEPVYDVYQDGVKVGTIRKYQKVVVTEDSTGLGVGGKRRTEFEFRPSDGSRPQVTQSLSDALYVASQRPKQSAAPGLGDDVADYIDWQHMAPGGGAEWNAPKSDSPDLGKLVASRIPRDGQIAVAEDGSIGHVRRRPAVARRPLAMGGFAPARPARTVIEWQGGKIETVGRRAPDGVTLYLPATTSDSREVTKPAKKATSYGIVPTGSGQPAKKGPGNTVATTPPGTLSEGELVALKLLSAQGWFADGGWVDSTQVTAMHRHYLDALAEKGIIQKHVAPTGDKKYRIDPRTVGTQKADSGEDAALVGDVLPANRTPSPRLSLTKVHAGAILDGYRDPDDPSAFGNVPEDGSADPTRVMRFVVQRVEPVDENGDPATGLKATHRRIVGHDTATGARVTSDPVPGGSRWSWLANPDADAVSPDIEGELVPDRASLPAAAKRTAASKRAVKFPHGGEQMTLAQSTVRQAEIDSKKGPAEVIADVHELLTDQASPRALRARIGTGAKMHGLPDTERDKLLAAVDDPAALRKALDDLAGRSGITVDGKPGDRTLLNGQIHQLRGEADNGDPVVVVTPGYVATLSNGETIRMVKAKVEPAAAGKKTTTRAATFPHDEAREVRDMDEPDMDVTELDETEELDEETTDLEDEPEPRVPPDPAAVRRALDEGSLRLRGILETRVAGKDVTPGHDQLHHYWTRDPEGLAKWAKSPHPWTALYHHLVKYVGPERAKRMAAQWHHEVFGIWPGEKKGQNPLGPG